MYSPIVILYLLISCHTARLMLFKITKLNNYCTLNKITQNLLIIILSILLEYDLHICK